MGIEDWYAIDMCISTRMISFNKKESKWVTVAGIL